jgi:hypothetical protein
VMPWRESPLWVSESHCSRRGGGGGAAGEDEDTEESGDRGPGCRSRVVRIRHDAGDGGCCFLEPRQSPTSSSSSSFGTDAAAVGPSPPLIALLAIAELAQSEGNRAREQHRGEGTREKNRGEGRRGVRRR